MVGGIGYGNYNSYGSMGYGYVEPSQVSGNNHTTQNADLSGSNVTALKRSGAVECETCKNREYQDGSNESDVSFKAPGHISPESSAATVRAHEQEHVANAYEKASKGNGKVVSATVSLQTAVCPECGRSYVSGGVTNTTIKYSSPASYNDKGKKNASMDGIGRNIDYAV